MRYVIEAGTKCKEDFPVISDKSTYIVYGEPLEREMYANHNAYFVNSMEELECVNAWLQLLEDARW